MKRTSIAPDTNGARLSFSGVPKRNYQVRRATTLGGSWSLLDTIAASNDGEGEYLAPAPPQPMGFYRLFSPQ